MFFFDIISLFRNYDSLFKDNRINSSRIFRYDKLLELLKNYDNLYSQIGFSIEKRKIFKIKWGKGDIKIFVWSQMHGNETTGTKSMFDLLHFFSEEENNELVKFLKKNLTISFIPMLNPDGSEKFQRRNAINIDLNRDAISLESPEIKILFNEIKKDKPHILFNLHDQRIIYNVGNSSFNPAILSFLSPSIIEENIISISKNRKISMGLIYLIVNKIKDILPNIGSIGRFSDVPYPTATGDQLQKLGYPCILVEAGNLPKDFHKKMIRKYNTLSILSGFYYAVKKKSIIIENYKSYFSIPENKENLLKKIYRGIKIQKKKDKFTVDIGLMDINEEKFNKEKINPILKIVDIGDLSFYFAYEEPISIGKKFYGKKNQFPEIGNIEYLDFNIL
ncbi:M14 family zinc carboxypeptidase [Blattabacterium cuenoti]|uniref:M14 family zinc carboxypeptidase n=1 Tax=Blattabacterium cuenoti TaxID=1653831 RepID=UPI00163C74C6|nr:M14 family zinc carboxypeptidase [Blattabacterium cuenoti]